MVTKNPARINAIRIAAGAKVRQQTCRPWLVTLEVMLHPTFRPGAARVISAVGSTTIALKRL
jgi:hypothetical protein